MRFRVSAEGMRRCTAAFFKCAVEGGEIVISNRRRNFGYFDIGIPEEPQGVFHADGNQILIEGNAVLLAEHPRQVIGLITELPGQCAKGNG